MTREARQEVLERHGLVESGDGFTVTLKGFQRAARRARDLRAQGNEEAARMVALSPDHPLRWEFARCLQIEAFSNEMSDTGF
ncbi:hypothetical protein [Streptomyces sp. NBC_00343]|uniref:hypothetical protein n=1 Tax=Streptomyces sp. NBC_00343 TaxID=2975719 RepID=UPI002E2B7C7B|nr:hypothetical protein [Streptomyces sp. NBC_00343]